VAAQIEKYDDHSYSFKHIPTLVWIPPPKKNNVTPAPSAFMAAATHSFLVGGVHTKLGTFS
jgi:hypothetical protein